MTCCENSSNAHVIAERWMRRDEARETRKGGGGVLGYRLSYATKMTSAS